MEQKSANWTPKFDRERFREDGAAFEALFAESATPEMQRAQRVMEHIFAHAPAPALPAGFERRLARRVARARWLGRFQQGAGLLGVFFASTLAGLTLLGVFLSAELHFVILRLLGMNPFSFDLVPVLQGIWAGLTAGLEALAPVFFLVPLWLVAWAAVWAVGVLGLAVYRRRGLAVG